jgi:hypothetical protein
MKCKAIRALQLLLGLILFSTGGAHDCGFDLVVEQVRAIGPGAWIQLITGAQLNGLREAIAKVRRRSVRARIADSLGGRRQRWSNRGEHAGSPAPAMGPRTATNPRISPPGNIVVWMLRYVSPSRRAAINTGSAVAAEPA